METPVSKSGHQGGVLEDSLCWILQHEWVGPVLREGDIVSGRGTNKRPSRPWGGLCGGSRGQRSGRNCLWGKDPSRRSGLAEMVMRQAGPQGLDTVPTVLGLKEVQPEEGTMGGLGCYNCHRPGGWCVL